MRLTIWLILVIILAVAHMRLIFLIITWAILSDTIVWGFLNPE
ncbi:hypothetical protein LINPERHAP1_LOCUS2049 [Linum perenne]